MENTVVTNPKPDESDPEWMEWFSKKMNEASLEEEAFWERRRRLGLGVGLDEKRVSDLLCNCDLVHAS